MWDMFKTLSSNKIVSKLTNGKTPDLSNFSGNPLSEQLTSFVFTSQCFCFRFSTNPDKPNWFCVCNCNSLRVHQKKSLTELCVNVILQQITHTEWWDMSVTKTLVKKKKYCCQNIVFKCLCASWEAKEMGLKCQNLFSYHYSGIENNENQTNKTLVLNKAKAAVKEVLFKNQ